MHRLTPGIEQRHQVALVDITAIDRPVQCQPDDLKDALLAVRDHAKAALAAADLPSQVVALRDNLAEAEQRAAIAETERRAAKALADERARTLEYAKRNLDDLRRMLTGPDVSTRLRSDCHSRADKAHIYAVKQSLTHC